MRGITKLDGKKSDMGHSSGWEREMGSRKKRCIEVRMRISLYLQRAAVLSPLDQDHDDQHELRRRATLLLTFTLPPLIVCHSPSSPLTHIYCTICRQVPDTPVVAPTPPSPAYPTACNIDSKSTAGRASETEPQKKSR